MPAVPRPTGVAITNPLVLYRALLATKRIDPDPAQHRLAIHLQSLYERLKDYEPVVDYSHRLNQISKTLGNTSPTSGRDAQSSLRQSPGILGALFDRRQNDGVSVARVLTSHEETLTMQSPKGLMLHGEVGTGKSMLIDLFADCLPNRKKKRWHFTTFMLEIMAKLEQLRRSRQTIIPASLGQNEDYSLLWLAREMISSSPILFLDEFQLPDRAASKIITTLMTNFFHLGGVLIATSNRMPEELAKAAGMEFAAPPPPSRMESLGWRLGVGSRYQQSRSEAMYGGPAGDFAKFLEVLRARCEIWQIEGGRDYRRRESEDATGDSLEQSSNDRLEGQFEGLEAMSPGNVGLGYEQSRDVTEEPGLKSTGSILPRHFFVKDSEDAETSSSFSAALEEATLRAFSSPTPKPIPWEKSTIRVYGRHVTIPRQHQGVCHFTFDELCVSTLGPADYITLAATYHTVILTDVPILSVLQKNEARRFITLLDALYEARCKLLVTAAAGPDGLFFPDNGKTNSDGEETVDQDAILSETISDIYQDATAPFRPNISSYDPGVSSPIEPDFTHARLAGILSNDQLEDGPPNRPHRPGSSTPGSGMGRGDSIYGLDTAEEDSLDRLRSQLARQRGGPNFQNAGIFTGEDEKFAYKRARSRLWEMCGRRWWERDDPDLGWWKPLDKDTRRWELDVSQRLQYDGSTNSAAPGTVKLASSGTTDEGVIGAREVNESQDEILYKHGHNASPFRRSEKPPPSFAPTHVWGFMKWGKKAGAWGQGVDGLEEREKLRKKRREEDEALLAKWKKDH